MIVLYLVAIVCANVSVALFGPRFAVFNSFFFIGLDLIARDALHERWHGQHLRRNMLLLIFSGSAISACFSLDAMRVAIASFIAFSCTGLVDTVIYSALWKRSRIVKMNGSNIPSSAVDSLVFVSLAFGFPIMWDIVLLAIFAKIAGGLFWSVILSGGYRLVCAD